MLYISMYDFKNASITTCTQQILNRPKIYVPNAKSWTQNILCYSWLKNWFSELGSEKTVLFVLLYCHFNYLYV
jgi:hypothetical protein